MRSTLACLLSAIWLCGAYAQSPDAWQTWSAAQAENIGKATIARGRVAGGRRLLNTERAHDYKVAATWLTPDVIRASARLLQLRSRLSAPEATVLVTEAENAGETVVMVDVDPDEGSGVVPLNWEAFLQPRGDATRSAAASRFPPYAR